MAKWLALFLVAMGVRASHAGPAVATGHGTTPSSLAYGAPASQWNEALPLGNGRIGAMVFGGVPEEHFQLNEGTLWGGVPHDYVNPRARGHLQALRQLIFEGRIAEAETLSAQMMGNPPLLMPFQPLGDLHLRFNHRGAVSGYRRSLRLDDATATVSYRVDGVRFRREAFISYPDQVLVVRLTADAPGAQDLAIDIDSPQPGHRVEAIAADTLVLRGQIQPRDNPESSWTGSWTGPGLRYAGWLKVMTNGGSVRSEAGQLRVSGADAVTLVFSAATSFVNYHDIGADADARARRYGEQASRRGYAQLERRHVVDFSRLFQRVSLRLGGDPQPEAATDARIQAFRTTADPALAALYYAYGRYLLVSSSRAGGQPANLQGIWNQDLLPAWSSKWTTNINLEMNYWPAESGDLWETQQPLWNLIDDLQVTGAETARVQYGAGGWVLHHNADLWRATTPVDGAWGLWPMGSAWLANQMWDHYLYSEDRQFLRQRAYPAIRGAVRFILDTLVEAPANTRFGGDLVTNPSFSPENQYLLDGKASRLSYATTMDLELITDLFDAFEQASASLTRDTAMRAEIARARVRLPPLQVGARGQLQEWIDDYAETEPEHRHVSHLYGLYPGRSLSLERTPQLAAAARRSLELRGDGGTGWARAWKVGLWAHLHDGNHAYALLQGLIADSTLPNLLDNCPPFQIDGNFGGAAAIAEMLLQGERGEVWLLPALPDAWPEGEVKGLRARGGLGVSMTWQHGRLASAALTSARRQAVRVHVGGLEASVLLPAHETVRLDANLRVVAAGN